MCGIAVLLRSPRVGVEALRRMVAAVEHRGPDDSGETLFSPVGAGGWQVADAADPTWRVGLGHRRLAILDLSPLGHQPMGYRGRWWVVFNGEIFNYRELRAELSGLGHDFVSTSDTEVILAAYAQWGTGCFRRFRGMWGLALFDQARGEIVLSRDRLGIKPLYWWAGDGVFAVASEIKQFTVLPSFSALLDHAVKTEYLMTGYEEPGRSFFRGISPVPAGAWVRINVDHPVPSPPESFWEPEAVEVSVADAADAGRLLAEKLTESVRLHLRSDVPVGCALSGGLDSSAIAVLASELRDRENGPFHSFTSAFPGDRLDESRWADTAAAAAGATAHHVTPDPERFEEDFDRFVWIHDEPVGSLSIYASYCVARLTRMAGVPVTLNGQGGDELLSGYWQSYYMHLRGLFKKRRLGELTGHLAGALWLGGNPALLGQATVMARRYLSRSRPMSLVRLRGRAETDRVPSVLKAVMAMGESVRRAHEIRSLFLPRLLKWDDRNSMAFSIEGRYPFLDHELIELCLSFASHVLYKNGWTKWPLRLGLGKVLPPALVSRRTKLGFEVPQDRWLRGPLRPGLERWLACDRPVWDHVERESARQLAGRLWRARGGDSEAGQALFRVYAFDRWLERFGIAG